VSRPRRVFIGLIEVAGYFGNLREGLEELGIKTTQVDEFSHPFGYATRRTHGGLGPTLRRVESIRDHASNPISRSLARVAWAAVSVVRVLHRLGLLLWSLPGHDTYVLSGQSFLRNLDLPLLKLLGKQVICVFTGSDHRPPYLSGRFIEMIEAGRVDEVLRESARIRRRVAAFERHADVIVALSASAQFHRKPFVHFLAIGIPFRTPEVPPSGSPFFRGRGVRILHCPSDLRLKGTVEIRQAIMSLRERGLDLDYVELTGRPHRDILAAIQECDFVVDEVYSDTPMAVFATEAASLGKPAVVTGYYAARVDADLPREWIPPSEFREPDDLAAAIDCLARDVDYRSDLGARAQAFVAEQWQPAEVANRMLDVLTARPAAGGWTYEPDRTTYWRGWGVEEWRLRRGLSTLLSGRGVSVLGLAHNSRLEREIDEATA
jgi:hypothetical protein